MLRNGHRIGQAWRSDQGSCILAAQRSGCGFPGGARFALAANCRISNKPDFGATEIRFPNARRVKPILGKGNDDQTDGIFDHPDFSAWDNWAYDHLSIDFRRGHGPRVAHGRAGCKPRGEYLDLGPYHRRRSGAGVRCLTLGLASVARCASRTQARLCPDPTGRKSFALGIFRPDAALPHFWSARRVRRGRCRRRSPHLDETPDHRVDCPAPQRCAVASVLAEARSFDADENAAGLERVRFSEKNNRIGNIVRGRCAAKISGFVQSELL